jgi:hypothetical protein
MPLVGVYPLEFLICLSPRLPSVPNGPGRLSEGAALPFARSPAHRPSKATPACFVSVDQALPGTDWPLGSEPSVMRFGRILLPPIRAEHQIGAFHDGIHVITGCPHKLHLFQMGQRDESSVQLPSSSCSATQATGVIPKPVTMVRFSPFNLPVEIRGLATRLMTAYGGAAKGVRLPRL